MLYQAGAHEDNQRLSDAGLKELSIVESDGSAHDLETPAADLVGKKRGAFRDYHHEVRASK